MLKRAIMIALAASATGLAQGQLQAQTNTQAQASYTSRKPSACRAAPGAAARPRDHEAVIYDCAGAAGWGVRLTYSGAQAAAQFTSRQPERPSFTLRAPYDIGPTIEWRSRKGAAPHAAIVRLHMRTGARTTASALAVLGLSDRGICLLSLVDPQGTQNSNHHARRLADQIDDRTCSDLPRRARAETKILHELWSLNE